MSRGPFESLNLSYGVGDDASRVRQNRMRFCEALGISGRCVALARQEHGTTIRSVEAPHAPGGASWVDGSSVGTADGLLTDRPGIVLAATSADCAVVAIVDDKRRVVGVAHCGWRGTFGGLAAELVAEATARYGVLPADVAAAVSPSIGPCCFEVGDEVIGEGRARVEEFERFVRRGPRRLHVDLWEMNRAQLVAAGVREDAIEVARACTRCRSGDFFSYRAAGGTCGLAVLAIGYPA